MFYPSDGGRVHSTRRVVCEILSNCGIYGRRTTFDLRWSCNMHNECTLPLAYLVDLAIVNLRLRPGPPGGQGRSPKDFDECG